MCTFRENFFVQLEQVSHIGTGPLQDVAPAANAVGGDCDVAELDYKLTHAKRGAQALEFAGDAKTPLTLLTASIATTPITHLSNRLQHLDHHAGGSSIGELIVGETGIWGEDPSGIHFEP